MRKIIYAILCIVLLNTVSRAQEDSIINTPGNAIYFELLGKPFFSLNADFRINRVQRISVGIQPVYDGIPNVMYYYLNGQKANIEIGGGISVILGGGEDFRGFLVHGVLGYRYQKKNGLLFRAGFTPIIHPKGILPMVGISFGYSL